MNTFMIKVGKVPGTVSEVAVQEGTTVGGALEIAGMDDIAGYELRVGGNAATLDTVLTSDTSLLLIKMIKGNGTVMVKVGKVPGTVQEVAVDEGTSVEEVLALAGLTDFEGYELRVGGNSATLNTHITTDTSLLLLKQIKGNVQR